jgi:hypothetical protein
MSKHFAWDVNDQVIRENPANRGTETSAGDVNEQTMLGLGQSSKSLASKSLASKRLSQASLPSLPTYLLWGRMHRGIVELSSV